MSGPASSLSFLPLECYRTLAHSIISPRAIRLRITHTTLNNTLSELGTTIGIGPPVQRVTLLLAMLLQAVAML